MSEEKQYPYMAWILTPAMMAKQVEIVRSFYDWQESSCGRYLEHHNIYATKEDALQSGLKTIEEQRERHRKVTEKHRKASERIAKREHNIMKQLVKLEEENGKA